MLGLTFGHQAKCFSSNRDQIKCYWLAGRRILRAGLRVFTLL